MKQAYPREGLARLCGLFGVTRQAYYQQEWRLAEAAMEAHIVLGLVKDIRQDHRRIGTRKLYRMLQPKLCEHRIKLGRDALFDLLSAHGLLVRRRKRKPQTTHSTHLLRKYDNLILGFEPSGPNQLWVSDITYLPVFGGFVYLSLVTDAYSHKIVGHRLHESLSAQGSLAALRTALGQLPAGHGLIHHSDRGLQYCCYEYVGLLKSHSIKISMTRNGDPYENAIAERVNGILKQEYLLEVYAGFEAAGAAADKAVRLYNHQRPHLSCGMLTPEQAHVTDQKLKNLWKAKNGFSQACAECVESKSPAFG